MERRGIEQSPGCADKASYRHNLRANKDSYRRADSLNHKSEH